MEFDQQLKPKYKATESPNQLSGSTLTIPKKTNPNKGRRKSTFATLETGTKIISLRVPEFSSETVLDSLAEVQQEGSPSSKRIKMPEFNKTQKAKSKFLSSKVQGGNRQFISAPNLFKLGSQKKSYKQDITEQIKQQEEYLQTFVPQKKKKNFKKQQRKSIRVFSDPSIQNHPSVMSQSTPPPPPNQENSRHSNASSQSQLFNRVMQRGKKSPSSSQSIRKIRKQNRLQSQFSTSTQQSNISTPLKRALPSTSQNQNNSSGRKRENTAQPLLLIKDIAYKLHNLQLSKQNLLHQISQACEQIQYLAKLYAFSEEEQNGIQLLINHLQEKRMLAMQLNKLEIKIQQTKDKNFSKKIHQQVVERSKSRETLSRSKKKEDQEGQYRSMQQSFKLFQEKIRKKSDSNKSIRSVIKMKRTESLEMRKNYQKALQNIVSQKRHSDEKLKSQDIMVIQGLNEDDNIQKLERQNKFRIARYKQEKKLRPQIEILLKQKNINPKHLLSPNFQQSSPPTSISNNSSSQRNQYSGSDEMKEIQQEQQLSPQSSFEKRLIPLKHSKTSKNFKGKILLAKVEQPRRGTMPAMVSAFGRIPTCDTETLEKKNYDQEGQSFITDNSLTSECGSDNNSRYTKDNFKIAQEDGDLEQSVNSSGSVNDNSKAEPRKKQKSQFLKVQKDDQDSNSMNVVEEADELEQSSFSRLASFNSQKLRQQTLSYLSKASQNLEAPSPPSKALTRLQSINQFSKGDSQIYQDLEQPIQENKEQEESIDDTDSSFAIVRSISAVAPQIQIRHKNIENQQNFDLDFQLLGSRERRRTSELIPKIHRDKSENQSFTPFDIVVIPDFATLRQDEKEKDEGQDQKDNSKSPQISNLKFTNFQSNSQKIVDGQQNSQESECSQIHKKQQAMEQQMEFAEVITCMKDINNASVNLPDSEQYQNDNNQSNQKLTKNKLKLLQTQTLIEKIRRSTSDVGRRLSNQLQISHQTKRRQSVSQLVQAHRRFSGATGGSIGLSARGGNTPSQKPEIKTTLSSYGQRHKNSLKAIHPLRRASTMRKEKRSKSLSNQHPRRQKSLVPLIQQEKRIYKSEANDFDFSKDGKLIIRERENAIRDDLSTRSSNYNINQFVLGSIQYFECMKDRIHFNQSEGHSVDDDRSLLESQKQNNDSQYEIDEQSNEDDQDDTSSEQEESKSRKVKDTFNQDDEDDDVMDSYEEQKMNDKLNKQRQHFRWRSSVTVPKGRKTQEKKKKKPIRDSFFSKDMNRVMTSRGSFKNLGSNNLGLRRIVDPQFIDTSNEDVSATDSSTEFFKSNSLVFTPSQTNSLQIQHSTIVKLSIHDFQIIKRLSRGAYGYVVLAEKKTSKDLLALKIMNKKQIQNKNAMDLMITEKQILNRVDSDFIVHGAYSFKDRNYLYIAMEYMAGGDLAALLQVQGRFEYYEAKFYLAEIVKALEYLRRMKYVHRDLKPDNILMDKDGHLKLTDFGLSKDGLLQKKDRLNKSSSMEQEKKLSSTSSANNHPPAKPKLPSKFVSSIASGIGSRKRSTIQIIPDAQQSILNILGKSSKDKRILGTPNYMSPEVIQGCEHSYPVDYWSLGVIAFQMIVGAFPFDGDTVQELFHNITHGEVECFPDIDQDVWPAETDDFIRKLLDKDQKTRLGTTSIEEIKQHKFFEGIEWDNIRKMKPPIVPQVKDPKDFVNSDTRREISDRSYNVLLKKINADNKGGCSPARYLGKSAGNNKNANNFGSLVAIEEEGRNVNYEDQTVDWNSRNMNFLKKLNELDAKGKRQTYLKKNEKEIGSIMDELNPSSNCQGSSEDQDKAMHYQQIKYKGQLRQSSTFKNYKENEKSDVKKKK